MKKRSTRLLLSLVLSVLSLGLSFSPVFAVGVSCAYDEFTQRNLNEFVHEYEAIISQTRYDPSVHLRAWKSAIHNYVFRLKERSGYRAAGEFFRDLVIRMGDQRVREAALRIGNNYIDFSILDSPNNVAGFFYENGMRFVGLMI